MSRGARALTALAWLWASLAAWTGGCAGDVVGAPKASGLAPTLAALAYPTPLLPGSRLVATVAGASSESPFSLRLTHASGARAVLEAAPDAPRAFVLTADDVDLLGEGALALDAVLVGDGLESRALPIDVELARGVAPALERITTGPVTFNERVTLDAAGLLFPGEGRCVARFRGTFRPSAGGASAAVDLALPVVPESATTRARGVVVLTTDLAGGLRTGDFDGEVALEVAPGGSAPRVSGALRAAYTFGPPLALGFEPMTATLGQFLDVRGAGFLGGADRR